MDFTIRVTGSSSFSDDEDVVRNLAEVIERIAPYMMDNISVTYYVDED